MIASLCENSQGKKFLANKKVLLDNRKHLSYPFIFCQENNIFLLCESYKTKNLILYKIDPVNLQANYIKEIFSHQEAIDPTLFFYNGNYWLFYSKADQANSHLYLAYSLFLEFQQIPDFPSICLNQAKIGGKPHNKNHCQ